MKQNVGYWNNITPQRAKLKCGLESHLESNSFSVAILELSINKCILEN